MCSCCHFNSLSSGFIWLLSLQPNVHVRYSNKYNHAQTHACLRKCQVQLSLQPRVMFKAFHLRLGGIWELIRVGTACPIGFPGLFNTSHKASTKASTIHFAAKEKKKKKKKSRWHKRMIINFDRQFFIFNPHTCGEVFLHPVLLSFIFCDCSLFNVLCERLSGFLTRHFNVWVLTARSFDEQVAPCEVVNSFSYMHTFFR